MILHNHIPALSHSIFHSALIRLPNTLYIPLPPFKGGITSCMPHTLRSILKALRSPPSALCPTIPSCLSPFIFLLLSFIFGPMECRPGCGACCIAASISSPVPGMPEGKPAGVRCIHLTDDFRCNLYNDPQRPKVCRDFIPEPEFCGSTREEAMEILSSLSE